MFPKVTIWEFGVPEISDLMFWITLINSPKARLYIFIYIYLYIADPACSRGSASEEKLQPARGKTHSSPSRCLGLAGPQFWKLVSNPFRKQRSAQAAASPKTPSGLHSHGAWNWGAHGFGGQAAAFGASFLQLPEA